MSTASYHEYEPRILDKIFIRNYMIFFLILAFCAGGLIYLLISGDRKIEKIDDSIQHAQDVIIEAGQLSTLVESMVSAQRAYIITNDKEFLREYELTRNFLSEHIARISELVGDNESQKSRINEIRNYFTDFSTRLEERAKKYTALPTADQVSLTDLAVINSLKQNMIRINRSVMEEEYAVLNNRIKEVNMQKSRYFVSLLIGIIVTSALLLLFNGFLLHAQRRRVRIEASLKDTERRFALAAEGTLDGIFDWNLVRDEVFYSKSFFGMLGYDRGAFIGKPEEIRHLLHPEDGPKVLNHMREYLNGEHPDYVQEFRLRHKNGHWVWVQSRAKAIMDSKGKAVRMVGANTDISHIKEYQAQLEADKKEAQNANRAKSDFLAHMSHEIRTPLTAISGIAEIFEKNQVNLSDTQKKLVHTLYSSTSALKDLINDILDFSKIESGELELSEESFDLESLFKDVVNMMSMRASQKGLSFIFDYHELKELDFIGDKMRLRQILVNLIGNALKFTSEGAITIKAYLQDRDGQRCLRIDVTDTGIGIASENFDMVFERFKQADASVSRKYGGTGLGLAISKNLASLMGGTIILSSQINAGSTFSVIIPHRHAQTHDADADERLNDKLNALIKKSVTADSHILLVEDYEGNIVVLSHLLSELGFSFDVARTGVVALDYWRNGQYDIILMDIQMPEMDGFVATKIIRDMEREGNMVRTPIIGMTAHALVGDKDKCIAAGMDSYLPKPLVETDLKQQILKYMKQKKVSLQIV